MESLTNKNIQTRPIQYLNHLQKPFKMFENYKIETACRLYDTSVNIPSSVNLKIEDIEYIAECLNQWKR